MRFLRTFCCGLCLLILSMSSSTVGAKNLLAKLMQRTSLFPSSSSSPFDTNLIELLNTNSEDELTSIYTSIVTKSPPRIVKPSQLSGCWQVADTVDNVKQPNWRKYSNVLGRLSAKKNRNFQYFSESGTSFNNLSEYLGSNFYASTKGSYEVAEGGSLVEATVSKICVNVLGFSFEFNVDGKGMIKVMYIDQFKRVLENEDGAKVMQIRVPVPEAYEAVLSD